MLVFRGVNGWFVGSSRSSSRVYHFLLLPHRLPPLWSTSFHLDDFRRIRELVIEHVDFPQREKRQRHHHQARAVNKNQRQRNCCGRKNVCRIHMSFPNSGQVFAKKHIWAFLDFCCRLGVLNEENHQLKMQKYDYYLSWTESASKDLCFVLLNQLSAFLILDKFPNQEISTFLVWFGEKFNLYICNCTLDWHLCFIDLSLHVVHLEHLAIWSCGFTQGFVSRDLACCFVVCLIEPCVMNEYPVPNTKSCVVDTYLYIQIHI